MEIRFFSAVILSLILNRLIDFIDMVYKYERNRDNVILENFIKFFKNIKQYLVSKSLVYVIHFPFIH